MTLVANLKPWPSRNDVDVFPWNMVDLSKSSVAVYQRVSNLCISYGISVRIWHQYIVWLTDGIQTPSAVCAGGIWFAMTSSVKKSQKWHFRNHPRMPFLRIFHYRNDGSKCPNGCVKYGWHQGKSQLWLRSKCMPCHKKGSRFSNQAVGCQGVHHVRIVGMSQAHWDVPWSHDSVAPDYRRISQCCL